MSLTASSPPPAPTNNLSLTDRATVVTLLTSLAAVVVAAWPGHDIAPFIQPVATAIAGLAPAALIFSKHHYAQGTVAVAGVIEATALEIPVGVVPASVVVAATQAAQAAATAATAVAAVVAAVVPAVPPAPPAATPVAPVAPTPPAA